MKKLFSLLLIVTFVSVAFVADGSFGYSATLQNGSDNYDKVLKYTVNSDNTVCITGCADNLENVVIPKTIEGKNVTSIANYAFLNSKITGITFSDTVKSIGWWAFYNCDNLKTIKLNNGLQKIGYAAFMNCDSLNSIIVSATVYEIGTDAFARTCITQDNINDIYSNKCVSYQNYTTNQSFIIYGYSGTCAEEYAENNGIIFKSRGSVLFGDVDCNGQINNADLKLLNEYLDKKTGLSSQALLNADVDALSGVGSVDYDLIKKYVENKISYTSFPCANALAQEVNYLNGKSIYCDGDSVAKGTGTNIFGNQYYSYCDYVAEKYNMTLTKKAVAGTTIARRKGKTSEKNKSILERVLQMNGSYDVIVLDGGFNDLFLNVDVGVVTPDSDKSGIYNEYTTAGALEKICYFLNKNYPDSEKLFVLCHKLVNKPRQQEYWDTIKCVLKKWGINCIDFSSESQLDNSKKEIRNQYFRYKQTVGTGDGIHPLKYTHETIYGPMISERLNKIAAENANLEINKNEIDIGVT